jgi:urease accessory protein UreF
MSTAVKRSAPRPLTVGKTKTRERERLGRRGSYRLGQLRAQGIRVASPPAIASFSFARDIRRGPASAWLLALVAGTAALAGTALLGWWFMPFAIGLIAGLLNRIAGRRTRVALPAVLAAALIGWGLALGWLGRHGLPFAAVERVIAAVHGFPHSATAGVTVTLLVAAAQVTAGYWLGRALTPRPLDDWSA